jgi:hypothetical protein
MFSFAEKINIFLAYYIAALNVTDVPSYMQQQ